MIIDIDLLDFLSPWRPFELGDVPTPVTSRSHGTGKTAKPIRPQMAAYWQMKELLEYDRKLAAAIQKARRQREEEEIGAMMEAGIL